MWGTAGSCLTCRPADKLPGTDCHYLAIRQSASIETSQRHFPPALPNGTILYGEAASAIDQDSEKPWIASRYQGLVTPLQKISTNEGFIRQIRRIRRMPFVKDISLPSRYSFTNAKPTREMFVLHGRSQVKEHKIVSGRLPLAHHASSLEGHSSHSTQYRAPSHPPQNAAHRRESTPAREHTGARARPGPSSCTFSAAGSARAQSCLYAAQEGGYDAAAIGPRGDIESPYELRSLSLAPGVCTWDVSKGKIEGWKRAQDGREPPGVTHPTCSSVIQRHPRRACATLAAPMRAWREDDGSMHKALGVAEKLKGDGQDTGVAYLYSHLAGTMAPGAEPSCDSTSRVSTAE
ncbi:hypothetical protein DFH09DRAFT_1279083 [Mycena vulgaris]|nr:hypothetical protein DFH09DRAFT_1279083 [Mycena vulgaris]